VTATDSQLQTPNPATDGSHSHGDPVGVIGPTGSPAERFTSTDPADFAVPTGREELWRFSPVRRLRRLFQPITPDGSLTGQVSGPAEVSHRVVAMSDPAVGRVLAPADRVSALAFAGSQRAFAVVVRATGNGGTTYAHLVVEVGAFAEATIAIDYTGTGIIAENVEIVVGDGAKVTLISVQDWDVDAIHLAAHSASVGRDATLNYVSVTLGGSIVRHTPTVSFAGPGATAQLYGLSFAGTGQHFEARLYIDHGVPNCTSNVTYKSALEGDTARTVWVGDVRIRPAAIGTNTYELNRNLLLSDGARADSVPNLEIETGEIGGAGHASATGRFDDLHLFYLQSRGIPEDEARRLVVRGFFAEVIKHVTVPELHDRLMASIDARLGAATAAEPDETDDGDGA
jgi:Fe-S cluster assembly protein SufD